MNHNHWLKEPDPCVIFKSLSDLTRLRCLLLLITQKELCVCELTKVLELPQPKISHHLAQLRKAGLVWDQKKGQWIYYSIHPDLPQWIHELLATTVKGIKDTEPFQEDLKVLEKNLSLSLQNCQPFTNTKK